MDSIRFDIESGSYEFYSEEIPEDISEVSSEDPSEVTSEDPSELSSEVTSEVSSEVNSETVITSTVDLSTLESELHEIKQGVGFISLFFVMFFFIVVVYLVQNWLSHYF